MRESRRRDFYVDQETIRAGTRLSHGDTGALRLSLKHRDTEGITLVRSSRHRSVHFDHLVEEESLLFHDLHRFIAEFSGFTGELPKIRAEPRSVTPRLMPKGHSRGKVEW